MIGIVVRMGEKSEIFSLKLSVYDSDALHKFHILFIFCNLFKKTSLGQKQTVILLR